MLHIEFHASKPNGFAEEEENFSIFFYVSLWFKTRTPGVGPSSNLGPLFEQTW